jgi:hypothetical protein
MKKDTLFFFFLININAWNYKKTINNINIIIYNGTFIGCFLSFKIDLFKRDFFFKTLKYTIPFFSIIQTTIILGNKKNPSILLNLLSKISPFYIENIEPIMEHPKPSSDLFGQDRILNKINENCNTIFNNWFNPIINDFKALPSFLFHGPPGNGKNWSIGHIEHKMSELVKAKFKENKNFNYNISSYILSLSKAKDPFYGNTDKTINNFFDSIIKKAKENPNNIAFILVEECNIIFAKKNEILNYQNKTEVGILNEILKYFDIIREQGLKIIIIATTNTKNFIDKAIENRFLYKYYIENPDKEARKIIIN